MKKSLLLLVLSLFFASVNAQIAPNKYWIQFSDKNNSPYSIDRPNEFLSERSIQRRINYGIALDEKDIPVNPAYVESVREKGAAILNPSKWLNGVSVEITDLSVLDDIEALPFVQKTRVLYDDPFKQILKDEARGQEVDMETSTEESCSRSIYGNAYGQINLLNGIGLHEQGYQGEDMWIGVCDSGFEGADSHGIFDNMREEGRLLGTRDFVYKNGVVYSDDYHGTACLGLLAGYLPNTYVGTAPKASYFLCRTENVNSENVIEEYNWVSAAEFLDSLGVDVISTSLGYISFDDAAMTHDYSDLDGETCVSTIGAEIACSRGILCVNAAGNEGNSKFPYIGAPADAKSVLTVGGVNLNGERTSFSSVGPTYDGRIKPDVMAYAYAVTVASPNNSFFEGNGTSYACPSLAGMSACLWQARRDKSAAEIRDIIKRSADNYTTPDSERGYGIPDFMKALDAQNMKDCDIFEKKTLFSVFPNPSDGEVELSLNVEENVAVQVFDLFGKMIYDVDYKGDNIFEINAFLSNLNEGVYLIKVIGEKSFQISKLIKN